MEKNERKLKNFLFGCLHSKRSSRLNQIKEICFPFFFLYFIGSVGGEAERGTEKQQFYYFIMIRVRIVL